MSNLFLSPPKAPFVLFSEWFQKVSLQNATIYVKEINLGVGGKIIDINL